MARVVATEAPTQVLTARTILGDDVVNVGGEHVGDLKDLMIDVSKGCIAYAVLDFGGFLGIGAKYFAIPWESFTVDEDKQQLVLNVSKEQLKASPGFDKDHWPLSNDQQYYSSVNQYFGGAGGAGTSRY